MPYLDDDVLDNGVGQLQANVDEIHVCSQEPTNYTEATSTYTLGNKSAPTISAPQDRTGGGRECEASSFSDGSATADGTASHFAWVDTVNTRLYAAQALSSTQAVSNGQTFSLTAHAVGIPDV